MKSIIKIRTTGLIILALGFALFTLSCRRAPEKAGEKIIENALENATGQKADVDLSKEKTVIETSAGRMEIDSKTTTWPAEIPDDVPEFKDGKIKAVTSSNMDNTTSWNIVYEEVADGFLEKYDAKLKEKGFETVLTKIGDKGGSIQAENEKYSVFLMGGEGNLSLGISVKKQE